jgi:hypothetical protein
MKTIKEAAAEYADRFFEERLGRTGARSGFEMGIKFAQRWISVEKELPRPAEAVLVKFENRKDCRPMVACISEDGDPDCWFGVVEAAYIRIDTPTHWRHIQFE